MSRYPNAIRRSRASPRQNAIIDAKIALELEPDGYECHYICFRCETGWSERHGHAADAHCPTCDFGQGPIDYVELWIIGEPPDAIG